MTRVVLEALDVPRLRRIGPVLEGFPEELPRLSSVGGY